MRRLLASGSKVQGGEGVAEMEGEDGEDGASAGRVEGGADAPAAHARPSEHATRSSCARARDRQRPLQRRTVVALSG